MNARRDAVRRAVRVTAIDLRPGDVVQPWNDRRTVERTVDRTIVSTPIPSTVGIIWTDGTADIVPARTVFHRSNVRL